FNEPELLDDLNDHWTSKVHMTERREFIQKLQTFAANENIRVTFVAGDVHCCGVGRLASESATLLPAEQDPHYMVQIISSAIVNIPPPNGVIRAVHLTSKTYSLDSN